VFSDLLQKLTLKKRNYFISQIRYITLKT
jgi:hypothetical protein